MHRTGPAIFSAQAAVGRRAGRQVLRAASRPGSRSPPASSGNRTRTGVRGAERIGRAYRHAGAAAGAAFLVDRDDTAGSPADRALRAPRNADDADDPLCGQAFADVRRDRRECTIIGRRLPGLRAGLDAGPAERARSAGEVDIGQSGVRVPGRVRVDDLLRARRDARLPACSTGVRRDQTSQPWRRRPESRPIAIGTDAARQQRPA